MELTYQDLPEGNFSGKAQELDTGSYETKGERHTVMIIGILAGILALGGVIVPLVVLH
ncbi:MAG: hypothetical protein HQM15_04315 [Deltaproteobacteria bacterium]|nr:hypothetical protein [Deltaproteobacteria bacterium]